MTNHHAVFRKRSPGTKTQQYFSHSLGEVPLTGKRETSGGATDDDKSGGMVSVRQELLGVLRKAERKRREARRRAREEKRESIRRTMKECGSVWEEEELVEVPPPSDNASILEYLRQRRSCERITESPFEAAVRVYKREQADIERFSLELSRTTEEAREKKLRKKIRRLETSVEDGASILFAHFCRILGFSVPSKLKYDKSKFDEAMESCFGSLEKEGNGVFVYGPINTSAITPAEVNRVFSLYLGRKIFCPVSTSKKEAAEKSFYERVCSQVPVTPRTWNAVQYAQMIARALFRKRDESNLISPVHSSGCVENSKSKGGKREVYWNAEEDEKWEGKERVIPEAIYTGGKVRVITKDSAYNMRYAFLNTYMARQIRLCRWSIFGQTVEEWLSKNPDFLNGKGKFLSGDLESATDLFNGDIARAVLQEVKETWGLSDDDYNQMLRFTTNAQFINGQVQVRGQLMGSILSFPILCIASFVAATIGSSFHRRFVSLMRRGRERRARRELQKYGGVGVNGDDVVLKTEDAEAWVRGVEDIGGRASRGKSLFNERIFTVNSEIWVVERESGKDCRVFAPASIRPTLLCSLAGEERKNASKDWLEYVRSPLIIDKTCFNPRRVLKPYLPTSMGGSGVEEMREEDELLLEEIASYCDVRRAAKAAEGATMHAEGSLWVRPAKAWQGYEDPWEGVPSYRVLVPKHCKQTLSREVHGGFRPQWSRDTGFRYGVEFRRAEEAWRYNSHFLTAGEKKGLMNLYRQRWRWEKNEECIMKLPKPLADQYRSLPMGATIDPIRVLEHPVRGVPSENPVLCRPEKAKYIGIPSVRNPCATIWLTRKPGLSRPRLHDESVARAPGERE